MSIIDGFINCLISNPELTIRIKYYIVNYLLIKIELLAHKRGNRIPIVVQDVSLSNDIQQEVVSSDTDSSTSIIKDTIIVCVQEHTNSNSSNIYSQRNRAMSLETNLSAFASAVGGDIGALVKNQGVLSTLTTTGKASLVVAINELVSSLATQATAQAALINDTTPSGTTTYSSDKINTLLQAVKEDIIAGAPTAFDTLKEIADYIAADQTASAALTTAIGNRVRYDAAQSLTSEQQLQACQNIGIGDPTVDLVAAYNTAKAAV